MSQSGRVTAARGLTEQSESRVTAARRPDPSCVAQLMPTKSGLTVGSSVLLLTHSLTHTHRGPTSQPAYCKVDTTTVVRAMARHRWRHCSRGAHASAARALQAEGGSGAPEAGREQAERRSEEVVRMAQEHYLSDVRSGERDGESSRSTQPDMCLFVSGCLFRLFDRVSVCVDLVSVCDRVEIYYLGVSEYYFMYQVSMASSGGASETTEDGTTCMSRNSIQKALSWRASRPIG